jgi:polyribonucleotide nucleotidyltransferase
MPSWSIDGPLQAFRSHNPSRQFALIDRGRALPQSTWTEMKNSRLNLAVAGMKDGIVMVEAGP